MKKLKIFLFSMAIFFPLSQSSVAQEFPVTTGSEAAYASGMAYDGTNYLMTMYGSHANESITAQLVSGKGTLIGDKIYIGLGCNPKVAFDGTNYLVVWHEKYNAPFCNTEEETGTVFGQFVSPSGQLTGTTFPVATDVSSEFFRGVLTYNDTTYLLVYATGNDDKDILYTLYGQRINKSGTLIGSPLLISSLNPRETAVTYDGTNYLVSWVQDEDDDKNDASLSDVYGQFLSKTGALIGTNFIIDDGSYVSDNGLSAAFDGSRFLVSFYEGGDIFAHFVTTSGTVSDRIPICDKNQHPIMPLTAFDGTDYLLTWISMSTSISVKGRFFNKTGTAIDTAFTIFDSTDGKYPLGGVYFYTKDGYFIGVTKATYTNEEFSNGIVYGKFLQALTTSVNKSENRNGSLSIFPNPTTHEFAIRGVEGPISIKLSDMSGRLLFQKNGMAADEVFPVDLLPKGVYLVSLITENGTTEMKLIKQ